MDAPPQPVNGLQGRKSEDRAEFESASSKGTSPWTHSDLCPYIGGPHGCSSRRLPRGPGSLSAYRASGSGEKATIDRLYLSVPRLRRTLVRLSAIKRANIQGRARQRLALRETQARRRCDEGKHVLRGMDARRGANPR